MVIQIRALSLLALSLLAFGCAPGPQRYRYQPPIPIVPADRAACHARADEEAQRGYARYTDIVDLAGPFGGPFGGVNLGQRAWEEREQAYESAMTECLVQKGYPVGRTAEPPSSR